MLRLNCDRWSTLPVVLQMRRQAKPRMHRLLPNRVVGRRESRDIESAHGHSADRRIAVSLPIKRGAAIRAEMKSNPIAAVGVALVDLPFPSSRTCSFGKLAPKWKAVPVRRWHAVQRYDPSFMRAGKRSGRGAPMTEVARRHRCRHARQS